MDEAAAAEAEAAAAKKAEESFKPAGDETRPHQFIFEQGAYSWDGEQIYAAYSKKQIN